MVDALDLKSNGETLEGSIPSRGTTVLKTKSSTRTVGVFIFLNTRGNRTARSDPAIGGRESDDCQWQSDAGVDKP